MSAALPLYSEHGYDPRRDGAKCGDCPLGGRRHELDLPGEWNPVRSELKPGLFLALAEAPGGDEERDGIPMIGPSGDLLMRTMHRLGFPRTHYSIANVIACRPPGNELKRLLFKIRSYNKRHANDPDFVPMPTPMEACRPRLMNELHQFSNVVLIGGTAARAFLGEQVAVDDFRGAPLTIAEVPTDDGPVLVLCDGDQLPPGARYAWKVLPTYHAAHVLRTKRLMPVFAVDLGRAVRHFTGALSWKAPHVIIKPTPRELRSYLFSGRAFYEIDIESEWHPSPGSTKSNRCKLTGRCRDGCVMQSPLEQRIRCIGFADESASVSFVVPLLSVDGVTKFYTDEEEKEILAIIREWWIAAHILKVGWNQGYYDTLALSRLEYLNAEPVNYIDGIMLARLEDSELPKDLGFRASLRMDVPPWKAGDVRGMPRNDQELWTYNGFDNVITAAVVPDVYRNVVARDQHHLIYWDHLVQLMCRNLHRMGLRVDQAERQRWETKLTQDMEEWTTRFHRAIGRTDVSPTSPDQVRQLLYGEWGLDAALDEKKDYSENTGEPSTGDEVLVKLYVHPLVSKEQREAIRCLRHVRKAQKMKSVAVVCRPRWMRNADGSYGGGWTMPDGRLRVNWSAHAPNSGRVSSSDPMNFQNISQAPYNMRSMFVPEPGHCFVSCDLDQIELKVVVAIAQALQYIQMFRDKWDPHGYVAEMAFGDRYRKATGYVDPRTGEKPKKGSVCSRLRDLVKRIVYGALYKATDETVHGIIVSAEDSNGELIDADRELPETRLIIKAWLAMAPEIQGNYWARTTQFWKTYGYVREPVLGRRRDCADSRGARSDEDLEVNEIVNSVVQPAAASLMAKILEKILKKYFWGFAGPNTGIVLQTHDSYTLEVPIEIAEQVRDDLQEYMTFYDPALPNVKITAEADITLRYQPNYCAYCGGDTDRGMLRWYSNKPGKVKVCVCEDANVTA